MRGAQLGFGLCALLVAGCPTPEGDGTGVDASELGEVKIPETIRMRDPILALRVSQSEFNTSSAVRRAFGRLFAEQLVAVDGLMRGGKDLTGEGAGGTASDQVKLLLDGQSTLAEDVAVDACGNPMLASFLTTEALAALVPDGSRSSIEDMVSPDAQSGEGNATESGVWDIQLGEMRFDGMVDATIELFPAPSQGKPGFLGHLSAFFLTDTNFGASQLPLYLAASKVQIAMFGMAERWRSYTDPNYQDGREIFIYPHAARDIRASFVGVDSDDGCGDFYTGRFSGPLPFGCTLEAGSNTVSIDTDSALGRTVFEQLTKGGTDMEVLGKLQEVLHYQIAAFVACPTFTEPMRLVDGPVELLVCPDGDFATCFGQHDLEQANCDFRDEETHEPNAVVPGSISGGDGGEAPILSTSTFPYLLTYSPPVDPDDLGDTDDGVTGGGGGSIGFGMRVGINGTAGQKVYLQSDAWSRITVLDGSNRPMETTEEPNTHCSGTLHAWTLPSDGRYWIQATGQDDLLLLLSDVATHAP